MNCLNLIFLIIATLSQGSWGGQGIKRAPPKPERIKKIAGVDPKSRADYNKKNIIISEKRDKKAAKYLVKDLPYPYTSRVQFERSMERPLGKEWNTRVGFQRGTLPRIVKKVIPMLIAQWSFTDLLREAWYYYWSFGKDGMMWSQNCGIIFFLVSTFTVLWHVYIRTYMKLKYYLADLD